MTQLLHEVLRKSLHAVATVLLCAGLFLGFLDFRVVYAQNDPLADFPILVTCEYKGTYHVFYLSRVREGTATYLASDRFAGTITLDGKAQTVGDLEGGSCLGKTLEQLRASGQAHDLKP